VFFLSSFFISITLWAANNNQETADPTFVAQINEEVKDLQNDVDKEFSHKIPETPKDLKNVKEIALAIAGEGQDFEKKKIVKIYWKKTYTLDSYQHPEKIYFVLVVDPDSKTASFGRFDVDDTDFVLVEPGTYLKIDGKNATCEQCMGGSMDQMTVEMQANKLLEGKSFDLEMKEAVREKIDRLRIRYEKGHPTQKRLLVFRKDYKGIGSEKIFDETLQARPLQELADKNNIQIIVDQKSEGYICTMIAEKKYKNLLVMGDDLDDFWNYNKKFFGLK
jgi:hypothetical protein